MLKICTALIAAAALFAAGCTSTPQASRERDAEAKAFHTHPNAGTVYVYRSEHDRLQDLSVLYIDGRLIGETLPGAYFRVDTMPGRHVLHGVGIDTGRLTLETRTSELYFVELRVIEGQSHFRAVPERVGRERVAKCCALLESWTPGQRPLLK